MRKFTKDKKKSAEKSSKVKCELLTQEEEDAQLREMELQAKESDGQRRSAVQTRSRVKLKEQQNSKRPVEGDPDWNPKKVKKSKEATAGVS